MTVKSFLFVGLVCFVLLARSAQATPVSGMADISGSWTIASTSISFTSPFTPGSGTGSFAGLTGGTISNVPGFPASGSYFSPSFMTFTESALPTVSFTALSVPTLHEQFRG